MTAPVQLHRNEGGFAPSLAQPSTQESHHGLLPPMLLQYWYKALRWRWVIIGILGACIIAGVIATLLMPREYTAKAQVEISREQKQITNVEGVESAQSGRDLEFYATQYALLRTRPLAERVSKELRLGANEEFFAAHGQEKAFADLSQARDARKIQDRVVDLLLRNIEISPVRTSRLVFISYTSRSPELSARIANAWAQAFIATSMDRQFASTADARRFLENRLGALRERLEQSERQAVNYASREGIVTLNQVRDDAGRTQASRTLAATDLEALNESLNRAIEVRISAASRMRSNGDTASEAISNQAIGSLRQQRAEVAAEYARLMVQYEPGYPAAEEATRRLRVIDQAIEREIQRVAGGRRQEYAEAVAREEELRERVRSLKVRLDAQQRASIQYAIYQREADTNRQLYDALLQRYKEIGIAGTVGASNIAIVETAQVPNRPSAPRLAINVIVSFLIGLVVAVGVVFGLEQIDEGIREPAQIQPLLGVPLLGHTPMIADPVEEEIKNPKSAFYEAYFSVQSNLAFSTSLGFPRVLMVTSTQPAEGKSSTSLALAVILGRTDKRVLLIDADMRSPSIHDIVSVPNAVGLSNALSGQSGWRSVVQPTEYKGMSVLPAGPVPPSAAELLSGEGLARLLAEAVEAYDHVIIDSPPVLGLADAPLLARSVDGCVLVVESRGVAVRGVRSSIARLRMAQANIFGAILTKLEHRGGSYGSGYSYGYGYGYGKRYGHASDADKA